MIDSPWTVAPDAASIRLAIVTTAGLSRRDDPAFKPSSTDYRVVPAEVPTSDLLMSHVSTNFDRSGFQQDINVVFPIDRLRELADAGDIAPSRRCTIPSWAPPSRRSWRRRRASWRGC